MNAKRGAEIIVFREGDPNRRHIPLSRLAGFEIRPGFLRLTDLPEYGGRAREIPLKSTDRLSLRGDVQILNVHSPRTGSIVSNILFVNQRLVGIYSPNTFAGLPA